MGEMRYILQPLNEIVPNVQCSQFRLEPMVSHKEVRVQRITYILLETFKSGDAVMAEVQLLQILKVLQPFQLRDAIRLYRENPQLLQGI